MPAGQRAVGRLHRGIPEQWRAYRIRAASGNAGNRVPADAAGGRGGPVSTADAPSLSGDALPAVRVSLRASEIVVFHQLATGDWIRAGHPLCLIGDSGTDKPHLLIAIGTAAAEKGYRVKYTMATRLVNELVEAADEEVLARTIARYGRVDLLIIDELGYMALDRRGAEMLFQVLTEREEKNGIAIASNESFSGWTRTFTDPRLCAVI